MPDFNYYIPMAIGGLFIIVGLATMFWGRRGEKRYYESLSSRTDVREYLEQLPRQPTYEAFKMGGWISIVVGSVLLAIGGIFSRLG